MKIIHDIFFSFFFFSQLCCITLAAADIRLFPILFYYSYMWQFNNSKLIHYVWQFNNSKCIHGITFYLIFRKLRNPDEYQNAKIELTVTNE